MGRDDVFYKELLSTLADYQAEKPGWLGRPEHRIDNFWKRVEGFAKKGIKPAKILLQDGKARYKNFFKWAANDHHIVETLKIRSTHGDVAAGKAVWKHASAHKKV